MSWEDKFEADIGGFFEDAVEVTYNPSCVVNSTAYPRKIPALLYESGDLGIQDDNPIFDKMTIVVKSQDVPDPSYRDTFTITNSSDEEEGWWIVGYQGGGDRNKTWTLELSRSSKHE